MFPCVLRCKVLMAFVDKYFRRFRTNVLCMTIARVLTGPGSKSEVRVKLHAALTCLLSPRCPLCCIGCGEMVFAHDMGNAKSITK